MEWISNLLFNNSIAQTILIYSFVIAAGVALGKIKFFGVSLGITFVLFTGIFISHFGFKVNHEIVEFAREFGLILFVFTIGLQVGPGFFSSFKKGGFSLNFWALMVMLLNVVITIIIVMVSDTSMPVAVGIMSGAVTNTPGLGAAQYTINQVAEVSEGMHAPDLGLGYAVAYPFGVLGIIFTMLLVRKIFNINLTEEDKKYRSRTQSSEAVLQNINVQVKNPELFDKTVKDLNKYLGNNAIVSRISKQGKVEIAQPETLVEENDILLMVSPKNEINDILNKIGEESKVNIKSSRSDIVVKQILVTNKKIVGKRLADLRIEKLYGIKITRLYRSDMEFLAVPGLELQMGDKINMVGEELAVENAAKMLGNSMRRWREPNMIPIFVGILLGVFIGSIPISFPGIPVPVRLGMAGGPLIVAILLSRYGHKFSLVSYTTPSANLILRELGIVLFLASVGLKAGEQFIPILMSGQGLIWMGYGALITFVPLFIVGFLAKLTTRKNYFELCGLLAGSCTDPPALAYANSLANNNGAAIAYSTVYPLTMFMRIIIAQMLILFFV